MNGRPWVKEQETYGVDYVTARDVIARFKKVLPEYSEDDLWEISDELMMQVNASYGPMTPDTAATQSLAGPSTPLTRSLIHACIHGFIHSFVQSFVTV